MPERPDPKKVKVLNQLEKFKQAAREVEADDSEERFDRVVRNVATAKPPLKKDQ